MDDIKVLEMNKITKEFNGVRVLDEVDFDLVKGEVHALVGANGAGKSTLMKVLNGIYVSYDGEVILNGKKLSLDSPQDAFEQGIAMIHQELDLVYNLDVSENIFMGREKMKKGIPAIDFGSMRKEAQELLDSLSFPIDAGEIVGNLPAAMQQLVLIARVVSMKASIVVMDEPTSSLSIKEIEKLFSVIRDLCKQGVTVIYISHFLEEIFRVADRVTVMKDGQKVITTGIKECSQKQIVEWMVGHKADTEKQYIREKISDEVVLSVRGLTQKRGLVKDVSFDLFKGEVLGIAGVVGSGRTELAKMIFGTEAKSAGQIFLEGEEVNINSPARAVRHNLAFVPENRKTEGLVLIRTISDNISLTAIRECLCFGAINYKKIAVIVDKMIQYMKIKCNSSNQEVRFLSGGNQQKVVIGKWLSIESKILILDQPTRGVDVGAKEEIYSLVDSLAKAGTSILFISDELEEILSLSDRMLIMKKGSVIGEFDNTDRTLTKINILSAMIGEENEKVGI